MFKEFVNLTRIAFGDKPNETYRGYGASTIAKKVQPVKTLPSKLLGEIELLRNFDIYYNKYKDYLDGFIYNVMPYLEDNNEFDNSFKMLQKTLVSKKCPSNFNAKIFVKYRLIKEEFKKREKNVYWKQGNKLPKIDTTICSYIDMMERSTILNDENIGILYMYCVNKGYKISVSELYNKLVEYLKPNAYRVGTNNYKEHYESEKVDENSI